MSQTWVSSLDIKFYLGVDGISLFLVVLTGVLFPIALFAAKPDHDEKGYYLWITLLEAGCLGVFCALDLFLFFLFFELTIVPLYFLIGRWGHGRKVYAATKFFLFTMFGSAFMLVSIVTLAVAVRRRRRRRHRASTCSRSSPAAPSSQTLAAGGCSSASPSPSR